MKRRGAVAAILTALAACSPTAAWAYVPHEYPAIYTLQLGGIFYLISLSVVLWGILRNRLHKEPGWRHFFVSVVLFVAWDSVIVLSRFAESLFIDPSQTVGSKTGLQYFIRQISIEGLEYSYYVGRFDFILLNVAMLFFYLGLREHLETQHKASEVPALALLNKYLGTRILVSEEVINQLSGLLTRKLGEFILAGKSKPVVVHELLCQQGECSEKQRKICTAFAEALNAFRRQSWDEAIEKFLACIKCGDDGPSRFYLGLCEHYKNNPPGESWDGVIRMGKK